MPVFTKAQVCYAYNKVVVFTKGSDNFSFDRTSIRETAGTIRVDSNRLYIDGKQYRIFPKHRKGNFFKRRPISFMYNDGAFVGVQIWSYGTSYRYYIK